MTPSPATPITEEHRLKQTASTIFTAGVQAVDPWRCIHKWMHLDKDGLRIRDRVISLQGIERIVLVGMGKASAAMAAAVEDILGDRIHDGCIITKYGHARPVHHCRILEAAHPVPDEQGVQATDALIDVVRSAGPRDLILCLISGGGSALSPAPAEGITLADKQAVTRSLLGCGATIHEVNTIRKHLSRLKGGQLCRYAHGARVISLILSDVIGDDLDIIASGCTAPDTSTFADCMRILKGYALDQSIPASVLKHLSQGFGGHIQETPKPGDPIFASTDNCIIGSLDEALRAAEEEASSQGFSCLRLTSVLQGEAREVAKVLGSVGKEVRMRHRPLPPPACILSGGETTVTLKGPGLGGRNMELALAAGIELSGVQGMLLLSAGTDGTDGPTEAAGAFASGSTTTRAEHMGLSAKTSLSANDSYHFFQNIDDLFITGPTGTNVMDMQILLIS